MAWWPNRQKKTTWGEKLSKWTASLFFQDLSWPKWRNEILLSLFPNPFNVKKKTAEKAQGDFLCRAHKGYMVLHLQLKWNPETMTIQYSSSPSIHQSEGSLSHQSNWRTLQSLLIIMLRHKEKRAPLGGLHCRKMLAFCCQKQFSSTLDIMRQYSNTAQWMVADVTKPQVSKKKRQQTNLRAFWTRALTDKPSAKEPHQESHKFKVLLQIYWEILQLLGRLTGFQYVCNALDGLLIFHMYGL